MILRSGTHHALPAVPIRRAVSLLAVKIPCAIVREGKVKGPIDIVVVDGVVEVRVDRPVLDELGAGLVEGRLGEGVVLGVEVKVHDAALLDAGEEGRVEAQGFAVVEADVDGLDSAGGAG